MLHPSKPKVEFVAAVGLAGTGKSTFVDQLVKQTRWPTVYFGGQVLGQVKQRGLDITPENERMVREDIRAQLGPAAMAILALEGVDLAKPRETPLIIDGLYSYAELKYLRAQLGERLLVIAIHASFETRVERLGARPTRPLSRQQIVERDQAEIENIEKAQPIALADRHFVNDGTPDQLNHFVDQMIQLVS